MGVATANDGACQAACSWTYGPCGAEASAGLASDKVVGKPSQSRTRCSGGAMASPDGSSFDATAAAEVGAATPGCGISLDARPTSVDATADESSYTAAPAGALEAVTCRAAVVASPVDTADGAIGSATGAARSEPAIPRSVAEATPGAARSGLCPMNDRPSAWVPGTAAIGVVGWGATAAAFCSDLFPCSVD